MSEPLTDEIKKQFHDEFLTFYEKLHKTDFPEDECIDGYEFDEDFSF